MKRYTKVGDKIVEETIIVKRWSNIPPSPRKIKRIHADLLTYMFKHDGNHMMKYDRIDGSNTQEVGDMILRRMTKKLWNLNTSAGQETTDWVKQYKKANK